MRPHRWHGRPPRGWMLARGIHRRIVGFMLLAVLIGGVGGAVLHGAVANHGAIHGGLLVVGLGVLFAIWPLAWVATFRIAWPLKQLAQAAKEINRGDLRSREGLPTGPEEVGQVSDALRGVADRMAKQLEHQRGLMAAVSHELRSPLGRARVLVEMSREGTAPASFHDDLQGEIDAMDNLVADLLATARIDFEAVSLQQLDAREIASRALELAELDQDLLQITEPAQIVADPTLMSRALAALLDNAKRYGGEHIQLTVRPRSGWVRFEVQDDGAGVEGPAEQLFEPFHRGSGKAGGVGLGLALVRQIAQAHGGQAGGENGGEGARFWIEVPR